jgi:3-hydroxy-9,10-secoandrosta-1,3,5(10)-triene-9,17-dione monooxygenase reductase component
VLWSLDRASDRFRVFMRVEHFAVNILGDAHRALAQRLARKGDGGLGGEVLREGKHGVPILRDAIAEFECRVEHRHDGGDHIIFVGRVLDFAHTAHGRPLVYYRGRYRTLTISE